MSAMFDDSKGFKELDIPWHAMFDTRNETVAMTDIFNRQFVGRPVTMEIREYTGKMKLKIDDREHLLEKTTALWQQRW